MESQASSSGSRENVSLNAYLLHYNALHRNPYFFPSEHMMCDYILYSLCPFFRFQVTPLDTPLAMKVHLAVLGATLLFSSRLGGCWGARLDEFDAFAPTYPLYKQCDSRWGNDTMHVKTLCDVGCLESSISMALRGWRVPVGDKPSNPGTLNQWLLENSG